MRTLYCKDKQQQLWFLRHIAREAMTGVFFTHRIARSDDDGRIFYVISKKAMMQPHARACLSLQRCNNTIFFDVVGSSRIAGEQRQ